MILLLPKVTILGCSKCDILESIFWTNQEEIDVIHTSKVEKICVPICKKESQRNQKKKEVIKNFGKVRI